MMKKIKKTTIGIILCSFLMVNMCPNVSAFYTEAEEIDETTGIPVFSDDFNSYEANITNQGNSVDIGGGWKSKSADEGTLGPDNDLQFGFNGSALYLMTASKTHDKAIDAMVKNGAGVQHVVPADITENQIISFNASKAHGSDAWGIKFHIHNNGKNYYVLTAGGMYTLAVNSSVSYFTNLGLYKYEDGELTVLYEEPRDSGDYIPAGGLSNLTVSYVNGNIEWDLSHGSINYAGKCVDAEPFDLSEKELKIELFTAGSSTLERNVVFDNFEIKKNIPYITSDEPENVLYAELRGNSSIDDESVMDLRNSYPIRIVESVSSANDSFDLYLSNDKTNWNVIKNCSFDEHGVWMNDKVYSKFRYVYLSIENPEDLKIMTDANETTNYISILGKDLELYAKIDDVRDNSACEWYLSSDSGIIENGVFTPSRRGLVTITVECDDVSMSANVDVQGEFDLAVKSDDIQGYIDSKKGIVNEINRGIKSDDNSVIADVLKNTGEYKIEDIVDIESKKITELEGSVFEGYVERIKSYEEFPFADAEDVRDFINTFENEYYVGLVCNLEDIAKLKEVFGERNGSYELDLENKYYLKYENDVLNKLIKRDYNNLNDLQRSFMEAYVLSALDKALSVEMVENIVNDCETEIGYDVDHYAENKGTDLYREIIDKKEEITTLEDFRDFIDDYTKPKKEDNNEVQKPLGGGSSGGGGGIRVQSTLAEDINDTTMPERMELEEVIVFSDLSESHWAHDSIMRLLENGVVSGSPDGTFNPDMSVTRAEFVKMLSVVIGEDNTDEKSIPEFKDVNTEAWFYDYFVRTYNAGIMMGDGNGIMRPDDYITREEMTVLIYRALERNGKITLDKGTDIGFVDKDEISAWAIDAVTALYQNQILLGNQNNEFEPANNTTRAEASVVIDRIIT